MTRIQRILTVIGIAVSISSSLANTDFYVSTNGVDGAGSGTALDPFIATSISSYNWVLTNKQPNYTIHYEQGIYTTYGFPWAKTAGDGCIHLGATNGITTIKLASPFTNSGDNFIFCCNTFNPNGNPLYTYQNVNSFELHDLVLDCDANNQTQFQIGRGGKWCGAWLLGNNIVCSNISFIHFGALDDEAFACEYALGSTNGNTNVPATAFGNVRIDHCSFSLPATNNTGALTTCGIFNGYDAYSGARLTVTNTLITNCTIVDVQSDFVQAVGFNAYHIENCSVAGLHHGIYLEANLGEPYDYNEDFMIRGNIFSNVVSGLYFLCNSNPPAFGWSDFPLNFQPVGNINFISNQVYLSTNQPWVGVFFTWGYSNSVLISSITAKDNYIGLQGSPTNVSSNIEGFKVGICSNLFLSHNSIALGSGREIVIQSNSIPFMSITENRNPENQSLLTIKNENDTVIGTQERGDMDMDTKPDLLWRRNDVGTNIIWLMDGTNHTASVHLSNFAGSGWGLNGAADFNGDCKNDLLFHNITTGSNLVWFMDGTNFVSSVYIKPLTNSIANWRIRGIADFTGDGKPDILWWNNANGSNMIWQMDGTNYVQTLNFSVNRNAVNWQNQGTGDFNGDGYTDIFWRNQVTGANEIWLCSGTNVVATNTYPTANTNWQVQAIGNYHLNTNCDVVFRNFSATIPPGGSDSVWKMDGTNFVSSDAIGALTDTQFYIGGPQ